MANELSTLIPVIRQFLKDTGSEFPIDTLKHHIEQIRIEISVAHPYVVRESLTADGTREYSIASLTNFGVILECVKAEYPIDKDPPRYRNVWRYGNTIHIEIDEAPTTGETIYLWCNELHTMTDTSTTLDLKLKDVLIKGVVAAAAREWVGGELKKDITPASRRWYHDFANEKLAIYQNALTSIRIPKAHEFYSRL